MLFAWLLAAFIAMPLIELAVLMRVHDSIGLMNTLALVIGTGILGAFLARAQGLMVLAQIQRDLAEGRMPAPRLMDGVMIMLAGVLLVTPGLLTDSVGFLLLVPAVRTAIRQWLRRKFEQKLQEHQGNVTLWKW